MKNLSDLETWGMSESAAWRRVTLMMTKDMEDKPKLSILREIADLKFESSCTLVKKKRERTMLMKLKGGTVEFQIEVGR